jgi:hypothetical protein
LPLFTLLRHIFKRKKKKKESEIVLWRGEWRQGFWVKVFPSSRVNHLIRNFVEKVLSKTRRA